MENYWKINWKGSRTKNHDNLKIGIKRLTAFQIQEYDITSRNVTYATRVTVIT